jgi:hypothetical protein
MFSFCQWEEDLIGHMRLQSTREMDNKNKTSRVFSVLSLSDRASLPQLFNRIPAIIAGAKCVLNENKTPCVIINGDKWVIAATADREYDFVVEEDPKPYLCLKMVNKLRPWQQLLIREMTRQRQLKKSTSASSSSPDKIIWVIAKISGVGMTYLHQNAHKHLSGVKACMENEWECLELDDVKWIFANDESQCKPGQVKYTIQQKQGLLFLN